MNTDGAGGEAFINDDAFDDNVASTVEERAYPKKFQKRSYGSNNDSIGLAEGEVGKGMDQDEPLLGPEDQEYSVTYDYFGQDPPQKYNNGSGL